MKYSILIPTFNSRRWIETVLNSVLNQTYKDFDILIVDGGSTDGTVELVLSYQNKKIKVYPSSKTLDIVQNWQRFITIPRHEFMTILGHDDILYPEYLEVIDKLIESHPKASLYQTHFNFIDGKGGLIRRCAPMKNVYSPGELLESVLKYKIEIVATGFVMRSDRYDATGGIPPYPKLLYADTELWIKLILNSYLVVAPETCFEFRFHIDNTSKSAGPVRLDAFAKLVEFVRQLKQEAPKYRLIVEKNAEAFLKSYAVGSCHKLLYLPKQDRFNVNMDKIVISAKESAQKLIPGIPFEPKKLAGVRIARIIDSNFFLRKLFLIYKSLGKRTF